MDLQTIFYTVGIVFMVLYTLLLISVIVLLFYLTRKIFQIYATLEEKIESLKYLASHPQEIAATVGAAMASTAIQTITGTKRRR